MHPLSLKDRDTHSKVIFSFCFLKKRFCFSLPSMLTSSSREGKGRAVVVRRESEREKAILLVVITKACTAYCHTCISKLQGSTPMADSSRVESARAPAYMGCTSRTWIYR
ncbi:hypothetical protein Ancab_013295 [Ancistrocladus abbreviatus]